MTYALGRASLAELAGVHPQLVAVVKRAIQITTQDFSVHDGLRTLEEQREYVRRGVSKTMASKHMRQADGYGHAVDLVPYVNGKLRWEWPLIYSIAVAVDEAATGMGIADRIRWGGVWDRNMGQYGTGAAISMQQAVAEYCARHPGPDFIDGPHFEWLS